MYVLHINSEKEVGKVNQLIKNGSDVFILVYMVGCGPCNATRPEWSKIESALKNQYSKNNKLVIVDIDKDYISKINHIGTIDGFPTIKYIGNYGKTVEQYEKSSITKIGFIKDIFVSIKAIRFIMHVQICSIKYINFIKNILAFMHNKVQLF